MYLLDMLEPGCSSSQSVREDTERDFKTADEAQESISSSSSTDEEEEEEVRSLQGTVRRNRGSRCKGKV